MAKLFGNLHLVLGIGLILAIALMMGFHDSIAVNGSSVLRWLHLFFGVLWIGLLYYLNFVQVPTMPKVPAELKKGVTGYIAPNVFFFFRWGALLTVLTGLGVAFGPQANGDPGFGGAALSLQGTGGVLMIGIGMWIAIVMAANVWFVIWPCQKKILGIVEATDEQKAKAAPIALIASRTNLLLSLPMFYCMVNANVG
jgi:uncharacterized membrane protein